jgi:transcriptional regulator with XRE-family HTH domain
MIEISLGQRIRELRDKADLSLRGLAMRIGISSPFLSDIELGRRFPSEEILAKLQEYSELATSAFLISSALRVDTNRQLRIFRNSEYQSVFR